MNKLSERAKELLFIVDRGTRFDDRGQLTQFFVPSSELYFIVNGRSTYISGSGDAASFKMLERMGLIKRPRTSLPNKYIYAITEEGRLEVEKFNNNENGQPIWS